MKVCVLGGCGYIGARLTPKLLTDHTVTVYDPQWFGAGAPANNGRLTVHQYGVPMWSQYDAVIYLAGLTNNNACVASDKPERGLQAWKTNVTEILWDMQMCQQHGVRHVVFLSSAAVLSPSTPYARAKLIVEEGIRYLNGDWTIIRAASVCGPSANMRFDTPVNRMVLDAHQKGEITVNGGDQWRTHVHIDDLCDFIMAELKQQEGGTHTLVGESQSILQTAREVVRETGAKIIVKPADNNRSYESKANMRRKVRDAVRDLHAMLKSEKAEKYANAATDDRFQRMHVI